MSLRSVTFSQEIPSSPFILLGLKRYVSRPRYLLFMGLISVFALTSYYLGNIQSFDFLVPVFVLVLLMPGMHVLGLRYLLNSSLTLREKHRITANDEGILVEGHGFHSFLAWEVFTEMKIYQDWILLFVAKNTSVYIYLPEIEDLGDQEILRAMVKAEL